MTAKWYEIAETIATTFRPLLVEGSTTWIRAACPMCEEADGKTDKKLSLGLNPETGGYLCLKCGVKGRLPKGLRDDLGLEDLGDYVSPELRKITEVPAIEPADGYVPLYEEPYASSAMWAWARAYLEEKRHLDPVALREMGAGAVASGRLAGLVIFPVVGEGDAWLGWFGRDATGNGRMKHRYSKGMRRADLVWNSAALYAETDAPLFVCEGVLDAAPLWPDGIACLGKPLEGHIELLQGCHRPIVCCLDGDAWEESWMLSLKLKFMGKRSGFIKLAPKQDPNDVPAEWLREQGAKCML